MTLSRQDSAGYMTNWAARLFARVIDRHLKEIGVSTGMMPVFFALGGGASLSQKVLAERAAVEQPTMAATLLRMERSGLIERRPDPTDGRSQLIALTPEAMAKVTRVRQAVVAVNGVALEGFDEAERAQYLSLLQRVVQSLEGALDDDR